MYKLILTLVLGVGALGIMDLTASKAQAGPYGYYRYPVRYYGGYYPTYPTYPSYNYRYGTSFTPYGYRSFYNTATVDPFLGYNYNYSYYYNNPYVVAPFHSVFWDPYQNRYIYTPGYAFPY
jgi:hypothetical protein